jgi:hypothetical protein
VGAAPAVAARNRGTGRPRDSDRAALRPLREELAGRGQGNAGNARATQVPGNADLGLSCGGNAATKTASGAPRGDGPFARARPSKPRKGRRRGRVVAPFGAPPPRILRGGLPAEALKGRRRNIARRRCGARQRSRTPGDFRPCRGMRWRQTRFPSPLAGEGKRKSAP